MTGDNELKYLRHPNAIDGMAPVAVRAGDLIFVGGQMAVHPQSGVPAETRLHTFHQPGQCIQVRSLRLIQLA